nr:MAG TPA: hypothetical protein [Caudoviricetes sp.]
MVFLHAYVKVTTLWFSPAFHHSMEPSTTP